MISNRVKVSKLTWMSELAYPWMVSNIWPQAQMFKTWREAMDFASGYNVTITDALNIQGEIDEYWRVVTKGSFICGD